VALEQREHRVLELAAGGGGAVGDDGLQAGGGAAAGAARDLGVQGVERDEALDFGLVYGPRVLSRGEDVAQVEERPRRRGDRDPVADGGVEVPDRVEPDPRPGLDVAGRADVDPGSVGAVEAPQAVVLGGAEVAQRRVSPDRENGGHEEAGIGEVAVPDGVDAAVQWVEAAGAAARLDRTPAKPERTELRAGDDAVLPRSERSDAGIEGGVGGVWWF
jgi:hypothetical protein